MEKLNKKVGKNGFKDGPFGENNIKTKAHTKTSHERPKIGNSLHDSSASTIELLQKYVGGDGLLNEDADLFSYAQIMKREQHFGQQLLLLKILVASLNSNNVLASRVLECDPILLIIYEWLVAVNAENYLSSKIVLKILEILIKLSFNIDLLVRYKFGRAVKKILQKCKESTVADDEVSSRISSLSQQLFDEWNNLASQNDYAPSVKRRSSSIDSDSLSASNSSSNDNIVEIDIEPEFELPLEVKKAKIRKVTFPEDSSKLCQVVFFERDPAEYEFLFDGSASQHDYLHADRDEALFAFKSTSDAIDEDDQFKPWTAPPTIEKAEPCPDGKDSEEMIIQGQRERTVLSTSYFSIQSIPPSPSENNVDVIDKEMPYKTIPSRDACNPVSRIIPLKTAPALIVPPIFMNIPNNSILSSLLTSPAGFNSLLNPFTSTFDTTPSKPEEPKRPSWSSTAAESYGHNTSVLRPGVCKFYRSRRPNSCKFGSSCAFLHRD